MLADDTYAAASSTEDTYALADGTGGEETYAAATSDIREGTYALADTNSTSTKRAPFVQFLCSS